MDFVLKFTEHRDQASGEITDDGSYIIRNENEGARGTFHQAPRQRVEAGERFFYSGDITGAGSAKVLFYKQGADRPSGSIALIDQGPGQYRQWIEVPSGTAQIRFDFRLWGPAGEARLDNAIILTEDEAETERPPDQVEIADLPEKTGQELAFSWAPAERANRYFIKGSHNGGDWVDFGSTEGTSWEHFFTESEIGQWGLRVDAANEYGVTEGLPAYTLVELDLPGKAEVIDFPETAEQDYFTVFWAASVPEADDYAIYLAQEAQQWEMVGETAELFFEIDLRYHEVGEYGLRVDARNENGTTEGDIMAFTLMAKQYPLPEHKAPETIAFSGYQWPGGLICIMVDPIENEFAVVDYDENDEPEPGTIVKQNFGPWDPEARPMPIFGHLVGRDGFFEVHNVELTAVEVPCDPEIDEDCPEPEPET